MCESRLKTLVKDNMVYNEQVRQSRCWGLHIIIKVIALFLCESSTVYTTSALTVTQYHYVAYQIVQKFTITITKSPCIKLT